MITGYNTDVKHRNRVFHVQTEDRGQANPTIETLIYVGGQVMASERTEYADMLAQGAERSEVATMMDAQHQRMLEKIKQGGFDDKIAEMFPEDPREEANNGDRTLDEVILEYLTTEAQQDHLMLFLDEEVELILGESTGVVVRASSSKSGLPISGATVSVRMISTVDHPRILASGETEDDGTLGLELEIPEVTEGASALIIAADSDIGKAELKYLL